MDNTETQKLTYRGHVIMRRGYLMGPNIKGHIFAVVESHYDPGTDRTTVVVEKTGGAA